MNDSNLFSSEIVRREAERMHELCNSVTRRIYMFERMTREEKLQMFDDMDELVEKQKILYTRVMLSDDEDSELVKENFRVAAKQMGIPTSTLGPEVFNIAQRAVDSLRETFEKEEEEG
jgi:hypothetical protein